MLSKKLRQAAPIKAAENPKEVSQTKLLPTILREREPLCLDLQQA
jgi:hypothetical protein